VYLCLSSFEISDELVFGTELVLDVNGRDG